MKIDGHNMPPRRGLNLFGADCYKDVTPTALRTNHRKTICETVIQKIFDELPVP